VANDRSLWLTDQIGNTVRQVSPGGNTIGVYPVPSPRSLPSCITIGPDGAPWFTEFGTNAVGRIDPATHRISEYPTPTRDSSPDGITIGPDAALWFTEFSANRIARLNPTVLTVAPVPGDGEPWRLPLQISEVPSVDRPATPTG
jgi:virginiamycin B lyase